MRGRFFGKRGSRAHIFVYGISIHSQDTSPKVCYTKQKQKHLGVRESVRLHMQFLLHTLSSTLDKGQQQPTYVIVLQNLKSHPQSLPDSKHQWHNILPSIPTTQLVPMLVHMNERTVCIDEFKCVQPRKDANAPKVKARVRTHVRK